MESVLFVILQMILAGRISLIYLSKLGLNQSQLNILDSDIYLKEMSVEKKGSTNHA